MTGVDNHIRTRIYRLKVRLLDIRPPIWRRFLVKDDRTLATLHRNLQVILGWSDIHGHEFSTRTKFYGPPYLADICPCEDERRVKLRQVLRNEGDRLSYDYDYGDGWWHSLLLEKIELVDQRFQYPWVLAGRRACPPENVGGVRGYENLVAAMRHRGRFGSTALRRLHGDYDPEQFDSNSVNRALHPRLMLSASAGVPTRAARRRGDTRVE